MDLSKRLLLCFSTIIITLPITNSHKEVQAVSAATCKGITPLTDPLAIKMENGETVIWEHVHPNLLAAKEKYEKLLEEKGWEINYNSVYRPYQYQKHLYEIVSGTASTCKHGEKKKHGLAGLVSKPNQNSPHTKGIAFDATVYDQNGKPLNGVHFVNPSLIMVAKQAGLKFINISKDGVHHQLITSTPVKNQAPTKSAATSISMEKPYLAKGKVTSVSGLNVRSLTTTSSSIKGVLKRNSSVEIVAKSGDWYKIKYGTGTGWIMGENRYIEILPLSPIVSSLKVKYHVNLYTQPSLSSKSLGTIAPQTVKVMKINKNGWYQIASSVGAAWIYFNPHPVKSLQVKKRVSLYSKPSAGSNTKKQIAPQKVKVLVDRGDGWYQISTGLGAKWINYKK
ncbi:SH3 domain-containing protein [Bacillus salipaludis]|uniref:SH3 domain-containing protein n=1 Tax=Bacillus salipaludis TaxID=2547811 RepID=UPI002E22824B|nr:SH3 domain-containing protein [Bacillus salipaludis]